MQYRRPHPWDPGFAIPDYVMDEPPLRGTHTTGYTPRRTIDVARGPAPWRHGMALPPHVAAETPGRGVYRTKYMPRRTVDTLVPRYLGDDDVPGWLKPVAVIGGIAVLLIMMRKA